MQDFTDDVALAAGNWNRRYARVLAKVVLGSSAVAIIDVNGREGGLVYERVEPFSWDDARGWETCGGDGGLGSGWTSGIAYAAGEAEPGASIVVEFRGERHDVEVQAIGYWLFAAASEDGYDELPQRVV